MQASATKTAKCSSKSEWTPAKPAPYGVSSTDDYLRPRYNDPKTGRFLTLDPFAGDPMSPLSLHKYNYTEADPVNGIDPTGRFTEAFGHLAHAAIGADHAAAFPFPAFEVSFGMQSGLVGPARAFKARPDILNFTTMEYNEIKPLSPSGIVKAIAQMALREVQLGSLGFEPDPDWPAVPREAIAGVVPIVYFNLYGVIFYTDYLDLAEDIALVKGLQFAAAAWRLYAAQGNTLLGSLQRVPQLVGLSRGIDGTRLESQFSMSALIASFGVV